MLNRCRVAVEAQPPQGRQPATPRRSGEGYEAGVPKMVVLRDWAFSMHGTGHGEEKDHVCHESGIQLCSMSAQK